MVKTNSTRHDAAANLAPQDLLDDGQLAAWLRIEPRTLRLWRNTRALPFIRLTPKVIRYRRGDVDNWLARRTVAITV